MSEPFYTAVAEVTKVEGLHRRANIAVGPPLDMGVHGPIKQHYRLEGAPDLPLPVDYIVAATGGWMLGTLNGALEVRQVSLPPEHISARVEGINEIVDKIPTLTEIRIQYRLRVPAEAREAVDRALETHQSKCPTAQSLQDAVQIRWQAEVEEV